MKIIESKIVGQSVTRWQVYSQHHNEELLGHVGTIYRCPRLWFMAHDVDHDQIGSFENLQDAIDAIGELFRWPTDQGERTADDIRRDIEDIEKRIEALGKRKADLLRELVS